MPYKTEILPNEPIIIITLIGQVTAQLMQETFAEVAAFAEKVGGEVWRISDYRQSTSSFADTMKAIMETMKNRKGSIFEDKIHVSFVGTNQWVGLMRNVLGTPQFGNIQIPTFETTEDALGYVRREIAKRAATNAAGE